jgi:hypothetical protein
MDRTRYEGYVAARDAVALLAEDPFASELLCELAESLLLARNPAEAEQARERVTDTLCMLVERGDLSRGAAGRLWAQLRACGPPTQWPPSWDRPRAGPRGWAVRGH